MTTARPPAAVIQSPTSYTGSARRLWRLTATSNPVAKAALVVVAVVAIIMAWTVVTAWYCMFGLLVVPWRLLRRGQRRRKAIERGQAW